MLSSLLHTSSSQHNQQWFCCSTIHIPSERPGHRPKGCNAKYSSMFSWIIITTASPKCQCPRCKDKSLYSFQFPSVNTKLSFYIQLLLASVEQGSVLTFLQAHSTQLKLSTHNLQREHFLLDFYPEHSSEHRMMFTYTRHQQWNTLFTVQTLPIHPTSHSQCFITVFFFF